MKAIIPALILLAVAGCTNSEIKPLPLSPKEQAELGKVLEGKVAGQPVSCVSSINGRNLRAIGDSTLVYQVRKDLVYKNELLGRCNGLSWGDTMVLNVRNSQYCRGDIARVVNLQSGMLSGSCALGDFVPYSKAPVAK
jgi:hypothetical protein